MKALRHLAMGNYVKFKLSQPKQPTTRTQGAASQDGSQKGAAGRQQGVQAKKASPGQGVKSQAKSERANEIYCYDCSLSSDDQRDGNLERTETATATETEAETGTLT